MISRRLELSERIFSSKVMGLFSGYDVSVMLNSNDYAADEYSEFNFLAGAGVYDEITILGNDLNGLDEFLIRNHKKGNRVYGYCSYDVKNGIENLHSLNEAAIQFPAIHFFVPEVEITVKGNSFELTSRKEPEDLVLNKLFAVTPKEVELNSLSFQSILMPDKSGYITKVNQILEYIQAGDIYELNYCHELVLTSVNTNPIRIYENLNFNSPNPFSAYYKLGDLHLICASPERFLAKRGSKLISQPMKGTAPRSKDVNIDERDKAILFNSEKERSENVMIVDLVRNDLSKVAKKGSVKVDELFGIYSFPRSHQMISTVCCELDEKFSFTDILKATFPMGSMTGTPKVRAMQLIDHFETFKRGIFSGTIGYISPDGNFDFNVVIRSIMLNAKENIVTVAAGGAITSKSDPEKEYEESIIKLTPQLNALGIDLDRVYNNYSFSGNA